MIELTCPHCGIGHRLSPVLAGSRFSCHACGKQFKVPAALGGGSGGTGSNVPSLSDDDDLFGAPASASDGATTPIPASSNAPLASPPSIPSSPSPSSPASPFPTTPARSSSASTTERRGSNDDPFGLDDLEVPAASDAAPRATGPLPFSDLLDDLTADLDDGPKSTERPNRPAPDGIRLDGIPHESADEIRIRCPVCESVMWVKPPKIGTEIVCGDCTTTFTAKPDRTLAGKAPVPPAAATRRPGEDGLPDLEPLVESERAKQLAAAAKFNPTLQVSRTRRWGEPVPEPTRDEEAKSEKTDSTAAKSEKEPSRDDEQLPSHPLLPGEWLAEMISPFRQPAVLGAGMAMSVLYFLSDQSIAMLLSVDPESVVLKLITWMIAAFCLIATWAGMCLTGGPIAADTAEGKRTIESFTSVAPLDLATGILRLLVPMAVAMAPGIGIAQIFAALVDSTVLSVWLIVLSRGLLLPVTLVSTLTAGSLFVVIYPPVMRSISNDLRTWGRTILTGLALASIHSLASTLSILFGPCLGFVMAPIAGFAWILQVRSIGLLGVRMQEIAD